MTAEPTTFALLYGALGYSPGTVPGHPAAKVMTIRRENLRNVGDAEELEALNQHPLMLARGHQFKLEDK